MLDVMESGEVLREDELSVKCEKSGVSRWCWEWMIIGVVENLGDSTIPGFLAPHDQKYAHPISMS